MGKTTATKRQSGFTIIELLVVIVVIGILASITIVSYGGVVARANTASSMSTANNVSKKAEIYNVDGLTGYPATLSALTAAAATTSYFIPGVTFAATAMVAAPAVPATVNFYKCGHNGTAVAPTTAAGVTTQTGNKIGYWDYSAKAVAFNTAGQASGLVGTYAVGCGITAS